MSGRGKAIEVRVIKPDILYNSVLIAKLINKVMCDGKKAIARGLVYGAMSIIKEKLGLSTDDQVLEYVNVAINNILPQVGTKPRKMGGSSYQLPVALSRYKSESIALGWLVDTAADERKGMCMEKKLSLELMDAYNEVGAVIKKKNNMHKMADSNRAFASKPIAVFTRNQ